MILVQSYLPGMSIMMNRKNQELLVNPQDFFYSGDIFR
jgi:hypothetical protein